MKNYFTPKLETGRHTEEGEILNLIEKALS